MIISELRSSDVGKFIKLPTDDNGHLIHRFSFCKDKTVCQVLECLADMSVVCGWAEKKCASTYKQSYFRQKYKHINNLEYFFIIYSHFEFEWFAKPVIDLNLKCSVCNNPSPHYTHQSVSDFVCDNCKVIHALAAHRE